MDTEFPFRTIKKDVFNLENLYKKVKICKTCFILYSMISREFDKNLKLELTSKKPLYQILPKLQEDKEIIKKYEKLGSSVIEDEEIP